jgi:uncharacterized protein YuzE
MKVTYDQETDTMTISLRDERIKESDEVRPGVIADFGYDGGIVRFEILDASKVGKKHPRDPLCLWGVEEPTPQGPLSIPAYHRHILLDKLHRLD